MILMVQKSIEDGCKLSVLSAESVGRHVLYIMLANIGYTVAFSLLQ